MSRTENNTDTGKARLIAVLMFTFGCVMSIPYYDVMIKNYKFINYGIVSAVVAALALHFTDDFTNTDNSDVVPNPVYSKVTGNKIVNTTGELEGFADSVMSFSDISGNAVYKLDKAKDNSLFNRYFITLCTELIFD